jgi:tRNA isopentenyl-2-thiomethyl-A-37 hydroxylase MiaE
MPHRPHIRHLTEEELDRYDLVPRWVARRAILVRVPVLPPGAAGMTSGRFILLRQDEPMDGTSTLIAHELVHVRQFTEMGRLLFLVRYVAAYLRHLTRCRSHGLAYRAIPQEVEAYERAAAWHRLRT